MSDSLMDEINKPSTERFNTTTTTLLVERAIKWLEKEQIYKDVYGVLHSSDNSIIDYVRVKRKYTLDSAPFRDVKRGITESSISLAFDEALDVLQDNHLMRTRLQLSYKLANKVAAREQLTQWLTGFLGRAPKAIEAAVLEHFIWQVKRKLFNLPVTYHLMAVFTGVQGTGKSTGMGHLFLPVRSLSLECKPVSFVTDERNFPAMSKSFITFFDEMSRADTTDIDKLKQVITATVMDYRPLFTNATSRVAQNCTFIGAANKDIRDLIRDTTGMRRFFQLPVAPITELEEKKKMWALINSSDSLLIWTGVNELSDIAPIYPFLSELAVEQEKIRPMTSIEEFLVEKELKPGSVPKLASTLYEQYREHCVTTGRRDSCAYNTFNRELRQRGFEMAKKKTGVHFLIDLSARLVFEKSAPVKNIKTLEE